MIAHIWRPETGIAEIEGDWRALRASEVEGIRVVWSAQRERLKGTRQLSEFIERMGREWAIETGIIENLYDIDRGVTQTLIERGFQAKLLGHGSTNQPRDYVVRLLRDQKDALDGVFDFVSQKRALTTSYIKELHAALPRSQTHTEGVDPSGRVVPVPLLRGDWKIQPNSPTRDGEIYSYCPPEQVASEIDRLVAGHEAHRHEGVSAEVQAAWLHHRFTQIHPFQDGNGRVARALASLVLVQAGLFPLIVRRDDKTPYLDALEAADTGDLKPLIGFVAKLQRLQFRDATAISDRILDKDTNVGQVLEELIQAAERVRAPETASLQHVVDCAAMLERLTDRRLREIGPGIGGAIERVSPGASLSFHQSESTPDATYSPRTFGVASMFDYVPNIDAYQSWTSMVMAWRQRAALVFLFHGFGQAFTGSLACAPFLEFLDRAASAGSTGTAIKIADEPFVFFHTETEAEVRDRFVPWLERVLVRAIRELTANL